MEQALQQRILELNRCRADYDDLFEKFKQTNVLVDEREQVYKTKIRDLTAALDAASQQNAELNKIAMTQKQVKKAFQKDARLLADAARMLEQREAEVSKALFATQAANASLTNELRELTEKHRSVVEERDGMVHREDHELLAKRIAKLQAAMEDMVSKLSYEQLVEDNRILKKRMLNDMVEHSEYEALQGRLQAMERRLPFDYVSKDEYYKLQQAYCNLQDDKRVVEESVRLVEETRDASAALRSEGEAKAAFLKGRVEQTEREIADLRAHYDRAMEELNLLRGELARTEAGRRAAEERCQSNESAKAQLMTQLAKAKLAVRHEIESKQALQEARDTLEKALEAARLDFSTKLIDSNHKIKDVFDATEQQLHRRIRSLEDENTAIKGSMDTLRAECQSLRDQLHAMDKTANDARTAVAVQAAYGENALREMTDLREQIITLKCERQDWASRSQCLQLELDDFKSSVFNGLSPSLKMLERHTDNDSAVDALSHSLQSPALALAPLSPPYLDALPAQYPVLHDTSPPAARIPAPKPADKSPRSATPPARLPVYLVSPKKADKPSITSAELQRSPFSTGPARHPSPSLALSRVNSSSPQHVKMRALLRPSARPQSPHSPASQSANDSLIMDGHEVVQAYERNLNLFSPQRTTK